MRQISVVTGLPPSKNGQTTVIEDEQVVSNFPKFLANKVNHIFGIKCLYVEVAAEYKEW